MESAASPKGLAEGGQVVESAKIGAEGEVATQVGVAHTANGTVDTAGDPVADTFDEGMAASTLFASIVLEGE